MGESLRESIETELRSCLISVKEGVPLRNLQRDFENLVSRKLPFRELGFSTLEAMLRSMPKVVKLDLRNGELVALGVANEVTAHITELIHKQRPNKPRRVAKPRRPMGNHNWRPINTPHKSYNPHPSHLPSWNANRSPLLQTPPYLQARRHLQPISYNTQIPSQVQPQYDRPQGHAQNSRPQGQGYSQNERPQAQGYLQNDRPRNVATKPADSASNYHQPPPKMAHEVPPRFQRLQPQASAPVPPPQAPSAAAAAPARERLVQLNPVPLAQPSVKSPPLTPQASLKSPTFSAFTLPEFVPAPAPPVKVTTYLPPQMPGHSPVKAPSPPLVEPGLPWLNPRSNKQLVDNYAFVNGLMCVYRPLEQNSGKKKKQKSTWLSQLILGDQKFVSYPVEMNSAEEANEEAAKRAVKKLGIDPNMVSLPLAPTKMPDEISIVIEQIRQIVSENPQGAVHYLVQEQFKKRFRMRLPPNWMDLLQADELFRIDKADETHYILFYDVSPRSTPISPPATVNGNSGVQSPVEGSSGSEGDFLPDLPDLMVLPDEKYWDVHITHVTSTANICFVFVDYSDEFTEFSERLTKHYQSLPKLQPVSYPVCGVPYCTRYEKEFNRVIVNDISEDGQQVLCDFPDVGDSEWLPADAIFDLDKEFLKMPFQALRAELAGLACLEKDTVISEALINRILGKVLVAEATESDDVITLLLYDTTTEEDINVNQILLEQVFKEVGPPALNKPGQVYECMLGGVHTNGDVRLQVFDRSAFILEQLLENVSTILEGSQSPVTSVSFKETYAVLYNSKWQRAIITSETIVGNQVSMLLIDCGVQTTVVLSGIRQLDGELKTLASCAPLAVRCRLDGLFHDKNFGWSPEATEKLLQLIPDGTKLILKVCSESDVVRLPCVELLKRLAISEELVSINQTLIHQLQTSPVVLNSKRETVERRQSRPTSFHAPSPPMAATNGYTSPASTPTSLLSQSSGFTEEVARVFTPERSSVTPPRPSSPELGISKQEDIPDLGEYFEVCVFSAAQPNNFICRSRKACNETANLFQEMQQMYNNEENTCDMHMNLIGVGKFYALKGEDGNWYRVQVQSINDENTILVYYVDCGNFVMAKLSDLQVLYKRFCDLPFQAIKSTLTDIKPVGVGYTTEECMIFEKMVADKNFVSIVREKTPVPNNVPGLTEVKLSLVLVDTSTPKDVFIHEELVKKGIAKKA